MLPELRFVYELNAELGRAVDLGATPAGFRRVIDIHSGSFSGPLLKGTLLPGGADWQIIRSDKVTELHAHYILNTHDNVLIQVKVRGLRHAPGDALQRIAAGLKVDPADYYFRIAPVYDAPQGPYDWLNQNIFIGFGERSQAGVRILVYQVL